MIFSKHPYFDRELDKFLKKNNSDKSCILYLRKLLCKHFEEKSFILGQPTLVKVGEISNYGMWRIYMSVKKITKKQRPRIFFATTGGNVIILLNCVTHLQKYKTVDIVREGKRRLSEIVTFDK